MNEKKFINGLIVKAPSESAPEYVIARLSIKRAELIEWLQQQQGEWINADIKESQGGKWYAAVDDWKPQGQRGGGPVQSRAPAARPPRGAPVQDDDFDDHGIPFATNRGAW
jgi:hypothetical protein